MLSQSVQKQPTRPALLFKAAPPPEVCLSKSFSSVAAARTGKAHGAESQVTESLGLRLVSRRDNFPSSELTGLCRGVLRKRMQSEMSVGIVLRVGEGRKGQSERGGGDASFFLMSV